MSSPQTAAPHVLVRGEAVLLVDPEVADIGVTVRTRARDRQTALERCAARQAEVTAVLASADDAVENSRPPASPCTSRCGTVGHRASRWPRCTPGVTVNRLDLAGELVVALGSARRRRRVRPDLAAAPDSPAYERARLDAVRDALHRARQYAAAFGAELTALVEVSDAGLSVADSKSRGR